MAGFGVDRSSVASGSGASASSIPESIIDAKGDLIAGASADTPTRVAVGANETRLVADSTQGGGLKYVADTTNYAVAAKGDLLVGTAADTVAPLSVGTDGYELRPNTGSTPGMLWLPPGKDQPFHNVEISESHAASAVTYTLKGYGGVDLSATNPGYLFFPSSTLTSASFDIVKLTSNISVTVSSGSTLGHASAKAQHTFIYAINNAGTAELAVSNLPPDYPGTFLGVRKISTTAEGGAGAADSATGIYSTTLRSNVTWIALAKVLGTQATAGTWAANPTQIDMAPFEIPTNVARLSKGGTGQNMAHNTFTKVTLDAEDYDPDGTADQVTNSRFQPNVAGYYRVSGRCSIAAQADGGTMGTYIYKNGSVYDQNFHTAGSGNAHGADVVGIVPMNGTTDYLELYFIQANAGSTTQVTQGTSYTTKMDIARMAA